jgi:hypothetical protein
MRRARVFPALVIDPRDTLAPVDRSLGTKAQPGHELTRIAEAPEVADLR